MVDDHASAQRFFAQKEGKVATKVRYPESSGLEVTIPLDDRYVSLGQPQADAVLSGQLHLQLPPGCAWCGGEAVSGSRRVQLCCDNSHYVPPKKRRGREVARAVAGGLVGGALGAVAAAQTPDLNKIKRLELTVTVPHCAEHVDSPAEGVLRLVDPGLKERVCRIQVRDAAYAQAIARASSVTVYVPSGMLEGLVWPDRCVVCGSTGATERHSVPIPAKPGRPPQTFVSVPVCPVDSHALKRSQKALLIVLGVSSAVSLVVGGVTWLIQSMSIGAHVGLCIGVGIVALGVCWAVLSKILGDRIGVEIGTAPVLIQVQGDGYILRFQDVAMAEALRQANGLAESPEWLAQQEVTEWTS